MQDLLVWHGGPDDPFPRIYYSRKNLEEQMAKDSLWQRASRDWELMPEEAPMAYLHWQNDPDWNPGTLREREEYREGLRRFLAEEQAARQVPACEQRQAAEDGEDGLPGKG